MVKPTYPHMSPMEDLALQMFKSSNIINGLWKYDVHLKTPESVLPPGTPANYKKMWLMLKSKRIDALCISPVSINIIEVKPKITVAGIGQLLLYREMYKEEFKPDKPIQLWLVGYYEDALVRSTAERNGIKVWTVEHEKGITPAM